MFAYWCLNDLFAASMTNEGVSLVGGSTEVGSRVTPEEGPALRVVRRIVHGNVKNRYTSSPREPW